MNHSVQPFVHVIWWGGWPWQWRFYFRRKVKWGEFGELLLGPVGFTWPTPYLKVSFPEQDESEPWLFKVCSECGGLLEDVDANADYRPHPSWPKCSCVPTSPAAGEPNEKEES